MSRCEHPNGRKPPAPPPHSNSGSSSTGSRAMVWVAALIFVPLPMATLVAAAWMVLQ